MLDVVHVIVHCFRKKINLIFNNTKKLNLEWVHDKTNDWYICEAIEYILSFFGVVINFFSRNKQKNQNSWIWSKLPNSFRRLKKLYEEANSKTFRSTTYARLITVIKATLRTTFVNIWNLVVKILKNKQGYFMLQISYCVESHSTKQNNCYYLILEIGLTSAFRYMKFQRTVK